MTSRAARLPWSLVVLFLGFAGGRFLAEAPSDPPGPAIAPGEVSSPALVAELAARIEGLQARLDEERPWANAIPVGNGAAADLEARLIRSASQSARSVVCIDTGRQSGSGVLVTMQGHILTNHHVVGDETDVRVQLSNGERYAARVLGRDPYSDVACIKIEGRHLPAIEFGDSDSLRVGQIVVALGDPFGLSSDGTPSVSVGIVSALHRVVPMSGGREYRDAIQTDAAINPGNSGGPLVDLEGRLVGINGAITSKTGANSGVAFAIPVNFVARILDALKAGRTLEPGFIGIQVTDVATREARARGFRGALVNSVAPGSPAQAAGLREDDVILRLQSRPIDSSTRLLNLLSYHQPGDWVEVEVWREGKLWTFTVQVGQRQ